MRHNTITFLSPEEGRTLHYRGLSFLKENGIFHFAHKGKLFPIGNAVAVRLFADKLRKLEAVKGQHTRTVLGVSRVYSNPIWGEQWAQNVTSKKPRTALEMMA